MKIEQVTLIDIYELQRDIEAQYGEIFNYDNDIVQIMFGDCIPNDSIQIYSLEDEIEEELETPIEKIIYTFLKDVFPNLNKIYVSICW